MQDYQRDFLAFAERHEALRFGDFTLKSGRRSPYFFNAGLFNSGAMLAELGRYYAQALEASGLGYDMLFGPAYKGIPLVCATAISLSTDFARDVPWCFNRKEIKDHGEGGSLVGAAPQARVVIVDDVITAGTAVRESLKILHAAGAQPAALLISLDRQERGHGPRSAIQELELKTGLRTLSIVSLDDLVTYLQERSAYAEQLNHIRTYRDRYGAR